MVLLPTTDYPARRGSDALRLLAEARVTVPYHRGTAVPTTLSWGSSLERKHAPVG